MYFNDNECVSMHEFDVNFIEIFGGKMQIEINDDH